MSASVNQLRAPFPYFGGKTAIADDLWRAFGAPKQYIEPFCGSAAVLLAAPAPASLEVVGDANGFIANFWRAVVHQHEAVAHAADYPVSHVDLGARHRWLMDQRPALAAGLADPNWPGDAKVAGWWLWGQCAWIGSGWCEWERETARSGDGQIPHTTDAGMGVQAVGKIPHTTDAGMGVQAVGKIPHTGNAGKGVQAVGKIPHTTDAGMGVQAVGKIPHTGNAGKGDGFWTSGGRTAFVWLRRLAGRLERVRVIHGDWSRCLNHHYGGADTAIFLDPPYLGYEGLYDAKPVAAAVAEWARANADKRVALCGHIGEHQMPGWREWQWSRGRLTYGGGETTDQECVWFSPACLSPDRPKTVSIFG